MRERLFDGEGWEATGQALVQAERCLTAETGVAVFPWRSPAFERFWEGDRSDEEFMSRYLTHFTSFFRSVLQGDMNLPTLEEYIVERKATPLLRTGRRVGTLTA